MRKNRKNFKAIASFEDYTGLKCVDLIQTEENFFTFKTFRKDPEDPKWLVPIRLRGSTLLNKRRSPGSRQERN